MDKDIKERLESYLDAAEAQMTPLAQEYLDWVFAQALMMLILGIVCVVGAAVAVRVALKARNEEVGIIACVSIPILAVVCLVVLPYAIGTLVKVQVAPRVVIIEQIGNLIR